MSKVWKESKQKGTSLLILLALADFAHDDGVCWPSVTTLAKKARTSKRNAQYILRNLIQSGEVKIKENGGPKGTHLYTVTVGGEKIASPISTGQEWVKSKGKGGAIYRAKGVKPIAPEPLINHQEPLKDSRSKTRTRKSSPKDKTRKELTDHFSQKTGLKVPNPTSGKQRREAATLWYQPIREICELSEWSLFKGKSIIDMTLERLNGMTVCAPNSIIKTARAIVAEASLGKGTLRPKGTHEMTDAEFLAHLRSE